MMGIKDPVELKNSEKVERESSSIKLTAKMINWSKHVVLRVFLRLLLLYQLEKKIMLPFLE